MNIMCPEFALFYTPMSLLIQCIIFINIVLYSLYIVMISLFFHWRSIQKLLNEVSLNQVLSPVWENNWFDSVPQLMPPNNYDNVLAISSKKYSLNTGLVEISKVQVFFVHAKPLHSLIKIFSYHFVKFRLGLELSFNILTHKYTS